MANDYLKENEVNFKVFLAHISEKIIDEPKTADKYISIFGKRNAEEIYKVFNDIFSRLNYIQRRVMWIKYGSLRNNVTDWAVNRIVPSLTEEEIRTIANEALKNLKDSSARESLENLINNYS